MYVESCTFAHLAWQELIKLFDLHDVVTKTIIKDKLHFLKMKDNEIVVKHIHNFRAHLEQLLAPCLAVHDDEAIRTHLDEKSSSKLS